MGKNRSSIAWKRLLAGIAGFGLSMAVFWLGWNYQFPRATPPPVFWIISGFESLGVGILVVAALGFYQNQRQVANDLSETESRLNLLQRELSGVLQINRTLMTAPDEKQLVEAALTMIQKVAGAAAVSFVPMDEWGVPLPAFSQGILPRSVLTAWAEHLTSPRVRQTCQACQHMQADSGEKCPALEGPFSGLDVHCLPARRGERLLGMLNMYLPAGQALDPELRQFFNEILSQVSQVLETFRLRARELDALRYYQQEDAASAEVGIQLNSMVEDLLPLLDVEAVLVSIGPPFQGQTGSQIRCGSKAGLAVLDDWVEESRQRRETGRAVETQQPARIQMESIRNSDGTAIGELWLLPCKDVKSEERQKSGIQHLSRQIGQFLEMERLNKALKFQAVIQERTRLAREIHDSLAQTLAYLKLTAARMQVYLGQGDYTRLNQAIKESHQALSEAYTDTRKAIDDLRLAPPQNLNDWLQQLGQDFERENGAVVRLRVAPDLLELHSEVQVQLMRIIQEALNNVRKHARAGQVELDAHRWNRDWIIQIQDDGLGFFPDEVPEYSRYGLRGMRERSEAIGADFQVISKPGQGTTVMIRLPVPHQEVKD